MKLKRYIISLLFFSIIVLSLAACGKETNSNSNSKDDKGTRKNPYTLEDTITITCYAWDGNRILGGTPIGTNTFEISNIRIENGELSGYNGNEKNVSVLVFDKKCIETCYEDGINWLATGNTHLDTFYDSNMQSIDFSDITEEYTGKEMSEVVYFEGTTYTEAYAMCKIESGEVQTNDDTYSLVRILSYDKNLDEQYVYIKLD